MSGHYEEQRMSETTETRKPFQNPEGSNQKQKEIARLRNVALDDGEAPTERLIAATKLLSRYGPSRRNGDLIRKVIKVYIDHGDYSVAERARKLKAKLINAECLKEVADVELPEEPEGPATSAPTTEPVITGTSQAPRTLSIEWHDAMEANDRSISRYRWRQLNEGIGLTTDERQTLLENLLGELPVNLANVQMLCDTFQKKDLTKFPVFRAATEWLASQGFQIEPLKFSEVGQRLLDEMKQTNIRDFLSKIGVTQ